jgi:acetyl-CoA synthetase
MFVPSADQVSKSNIGRFMDKHGIANWQQLVDRANNNIEWYWNAVNEDLEIEWFQIYDQTLGRNGS